MQRKHSQLRQERMKAARQKGSHTKREWEQLLAKWSFCPRCGCEHKKLTKDHIVAIVDGGSDAISNIQPLCTSCNTSKFKQLDYEANYMEIYERTKAFEIVCKCPKCFPLFIREMLIVDHRAYSVLYELLDLETAADKHLATFKHGYREIKEVKQLTQRREATAKLIDEFAAIWGFKRGRLM